ncbi:hypothetical protein JM16_003165 [Phytophthora kernoviae]|uniref:Cilia- and flagella-associated protein 36 n=1 Tax=Phytophthora kernoviae TaxID=325452 RepID=A0A8T0M2Q8_9STRA|nr:hypothetical protein JM16_003165 [Phytophthora kernoviae]
MASFDAIDLLLRYETPLVKDMEADDDVLEWEIALSEERQRHTRLSFFVQILFACCEYEQFLNLMKRVADPEYYDKKELQYEAETLVYEAEEKGSSDAERAAGAQAFLDFFQANPDISLDELTQEFQKKMQLT